MANFLVTVIAIFLDRLFGEPTVYHPLKGFTRLAIYVEDQWHQHRDITKHSPQAKPIQEEKQLAADIEPDNSANRAFDNAIKIKGGLAAIFLIIPFVSLTAILGESLPAPLNFVFNVLILYLAIGAHNLKQHVFDIQKALISEDLELARKNLATIVNRDTQQMDRQDIVSTCIESILENGSEMILAPIFWFLVLGAPGAVLCGLVHTLNIMWGYQSPHYKNFGWFIGKVNDALNWVPSRLTAFSYIVLGDMKNGWHCFNIQAKNWNSPNAELVVATGAGALNLEIGGDLYYQEQLKGRSKLGNGKIPDLSDIARASDLIDRSMILWLAFILVLSLGH